LRLRSLGDPPLLARAIADYKQALEIIGAKADSSEDHTNTQLRIELTAECYESLARAYLQAFKTDASASKLALDAANKAVVLRRQMISSSGRNIDYTEDLALCLVLLAHAHIAQGDDLHQINKQFIMEEKYIGQYHRDSWVGVEFLVCQAQLANRLGEQTEALMKLKAAARIQANFYGVNSPEYLSLLKKIKAINAGDKVLSDQLFW
jgi:hypothetical protein